MSRPSAFHLSFTCDAAALALFCPDQWTACSEVACVAFTCRFFDFMWGGAALIDEGIGEACDPGDASDSFDVDFLIFAVRAFGDDVADREAPGDDNAALICASFRCLSASSACIWKNSDHSVNSSTVISSSSWAMVIPSFSARMKRNFLSADSLSFFQAPPHRLP